MTVIEMKKLIQIKDKIKNMTIEDLQHQILLLSEQIIRMKNDIDDYENQIIGYEKILSRGLMITNEVDFNFKLQSECEHADEFIKFIDDYCRYYN